MNNSRRNTHKTFTDEIQIQIFLEQKYNVEQNNYKYKTFFPEQKYNVNQNKYNNFPKQKYNAKENKYKTIPERDATHS